MRKESVNFSGTWLRSVSKTKARKEFNKGNDIWLLPANIRPCNPYFSPCLVDNDMEITDFEKVVNVYEFYNCSCNETGKYAKFFIVDVTRTLTENF